jgi:hypothetical protein
MFMGVHGCSEDLQMAGVPYFEPRDAKSSQCFIQHGAKRSGGCEAVPKSIGWTCQPGDSNKYTHGLGMPQFGTAMIIK